MLGELDPFDFDLADAIGCTVEEMRQRISNQEYLQRRALAVYRAEQAKLAAKAARRG